MVKQVGLREQTKIAEQYCAIFLSDASCKEDSRNMMAVSMPQPPWIPSRLSFILWFWHLFWHHFGIMRPKSKLHERPKMPKLRQLWSLMMPTSESHDAKMMPKKTYQNQAS